MARSGRAAATGAFVVGMAVLAASGCSSVRERPLSGDSLMGQAGDWQPGDALPRDLVEYRAPRRCLAVLTDTDVIFQSISNLPLLEAMIWAPETPAGTWNAAVERALHVAGPTAFFTDVRERARDHPKDFRRGRLGGLLGRSARPHVRAEGMFIDDMDMPPAEARSVLEEARTRVEQGEGWMNVFVSLLERYREPPSRGPCPGSKIAYLGEIVVSPTRGDDLPFRELFLGGETVPRLLSSRQGDLRIVRDPQAERTVLYKITEVFRPARSASGP